MMTSVVGTAEGEFSLSLSDLGDFFFRVLWETVQIASHLKGPVERDPELILK